jgi:hypothetical protein
MNGGSIGLPSGGLRRVSPDGAIGIVLFSMVLAVYLIMDITFAVSAYWRAVALFAAALGALGSLLGRRLGRGLRLAILALCCTATVAVRYVDWNSRKPFLRDLFSVRTGMSRADVERVMGPYAHVPQVYADRPPLPGSSTMQSEAPLAYRHTTAGWGDSDVGVVHFSGGRVVSVQFYPD